MEEKETKLVLTPSALFTFLSQIDEIPNDLDIAIEENGDSLTVFIGESMYVLESPEQSSVSVDVETVDEIDDIDNEGFDEFEQEFGDIVDEEAVEGGIIKEIAKTLLVGGLVRLTKNAISKM